MNAMIDVRCAKCGRRYGFQGRLADQPPCPKCGHRPDPAALAAADAEMEEFERLLALRPRDAAGDELRKQRRIAGLDMGQVERLTGIPVPDLSAMEHGRLKPTPEQADKLAEAYGVGGEW